MKLRAFFLRNELLAISVAAAAVVAQEDVTDDDGSCSICAEGEVVTNPDTVVREHTAGFTLARQTCGEIEDLASSGSYSYFQCSLLYASSIGDTCGCGQPSDEQDDTQVGTASNEGDDTSAATEMFTDFLASGVVAVAAATTAFLLN